MVYGAASREGGKLSVRTSIPGTVLMLLGSVLLAAGSGALCVGWFVTLPEQVEEMPLVLLVVTRLVTLPILAISIAGVLLFGFGTVFFLGRLLFFWRPIFELGPDGIIDEASAVGVGFVPWEEVKKVELRGMGGQRFLAVQVADERALLGRQNLVKRLFIRLNRRHFTGAQINAPLNALAMPERELAAEIARHMGLSGEASGEFLSEVGAEGPADRDGDEAPAFTARGIAVSVTRWIVMAVLSIFYFVTSGLLVMFGGACVWNGIGPGESPILDYPVAGVIMLTAGILVFVFFPRLVKKLTGREILSGPYSGGS